MADPVTLGISLASMGISAASGVVGAAGAATTAAANSKTYQYQAAIAQLNSNISNQNSEFAYQTGEQQAVQAGIKGGQQMGAIKAAQASTGFDIRSGSAQNVQASQASTTALDLQQIRSNAAQTAYGYQEQGQIATEQGQVYTAASQDALTAGNIGVASSFLGSASSVSSEWLNASRLGYAPGQPGGIFGGTA